MARNAFLAALVCLFIFGAAPPAAARTTATYGQRSIGESCGSLANGADFDTLFQCTSSAAGNGGTKQTAPIVVGTVTAPPYADTLCDSNKAGMLQYTGGVFQGCNGTSWQSFVNETNVPAAFSFTDQTNVSASATITSNTATLSGFTGSLTATCSGCSAIARNGVWGGTSVIGFVAGDTIALRVTSSASAGTAVSATVTVGTTTSGTWMVTTTATTPAAFSFTDQTDVATTQTVTSNAATLTGFTGSLTATCGSNCYAICRNGVCGGTVLSGFVANDTISIRQKSSSTTGTATTANVTVGMTTSSVWTVTTATACQGGITIGQTCPDGTIYAGLSSDGNVPMYTTPCDSGKYWSGGACVACASGLWSGSGTTCDTTWSIRTDGLVQWNNGGSTWTVTGYTSNDTGLTNTAGLVALVDAGSPYKAANYCDGLTAYGKSDWYLPARGELSVMQTNKTAIGNFDTSGTSYWSSTESNNTSAWLQRFSDGNQSTYYKYNASLVRCVRR